MDGEVLHARLLGSMDLRRGERRLGPLDSARAESLLAYLLLHKDAPQPRQHLAFLLWPGSTERQAHTNLRKVLHTLRQALPETDQLTDVGLRSLQWRPGIPLWLDVEHFEWALAAGRLEEAVETYAGDLLEGRYDEWLLGERARLAGLHLDALEELDDRQTGRCRSTPHADLDHRDTSPLAPGRPVRRASPDGVPSALLSGGYVSAYWDYAGTDTTVYSAFTVAAGHRHAWG
ncbi:hypothetical protein P1P75_19440 [Streptomyces sp. ID05-39B]|uniref:AfsR/SARP family transcriptional regulator n=1 Tax=Streptomyces sp. ID05-39B TaxID=3028664 RepID=UPI0029BDB36A|nr:hypothetical protein [Streptomyces sp. ID05-39B]MDX3528560.1 hypothetical protein [Streptomyces sp. ID05-39B]